MSGNRWRRTSGHRSQRCDEPLGSDRNVRHRRLDEENQVRVENESAGGRGYPSWHGREALRGWVNSPEPASGSRGVGASRSKFDSRIEDCSKAHASSTKIEVMITNLAGSSVLGPEEMPTTVSIASVKERVRKTRPGHGVKILHELRELRDHDTLVTCSPASMGTLNLTAVLSKTYRVVVWGEDAYGGAGTASRVSLDDGVLELFSTSGAFAVIKEGGAVSAWGHGAYGGEVGRVSSQLTSDVTTICAGQNAFVAVKTNGSAVAWGNGSLGGRVSGDVAKRLSSGVTSVQSSGEAFAALRGSPGEVVTWGQAVSGGDSSAVSRQLAGGVVKLHSTRGAFAALKQDGSVVTWGNAHSGGNSSSVSSQLDSGVQRIVSNATAFAALKEGGMVVVWGNGNCGGHLGSVAEKLGGSSVIDIFSSGSAFAAKKADGAVITWGMHGHPSVAAEVLAHGGIAVKTNGRSLAMVLESGEVVTDGDAESGGDASKVASQLRSGVVALAGTQGAFAARKEDGSVVTWGRSKPVNLGGDSSSVASCLEGGVLSVVASQGAFAALREVAK